MSSYLLQDERPVVQQIIFLLVLTALAVGVSAAAWFIWNGAVLWPIALVMVAGATVGGYAGARFARRIGKEKARAAVVVIGLGVTLVLLLQRA